MESIFERNQLRINGHPFGIRTLKQQQQKAGSAAEIAAKKKHIKYKALKEINFTIIQFAVETIVFTDKLDNMLNSATGEIRSKEFFKKNISLAIQRGNGASITGSYRTDNKFTEIFYIL